MSKITFLPLYALPAYNYSVSLSGLNITLSFTLNTRQNIYHIDLLDEAQQPLLQGLALLPETPLGDLYRLVGLSGYFYLQPVSEKISWNNTDPLLIANSYTFAYISEE